MDEDTSLARITREAAEWWSKIGPRSPEEIPYADRQQFAQWLRLSPVHIAEILRIARVHHALTRFKLWSEVDVNLGASGNRNVVPFHAAQSMQKPSSKTLLRIRSRTFVTAGVCAIAAVVLAIWVLPLVRGISYETDRAERREIVLNDGSVVQLEPQTTIRVRLRQTERLVSLNRGRALFHVAKNSERPFLVRSGETVVRAVGTAFGVEQKSTGVTVTVAEGKIAVSQVRAVGLKRPDDAFLIANQQVTVAKSGKITPVRQVDSARALAWAQGRLVYDSTPLSEVVTEFNLYNNVELRVDDPQLARRPVSGVFQASDPESLIAFIQAGADVVVAREGDRRITISRPAQP